MFFIDSSFCLLSAALTKISSKILYSPGTNLTLRSSISSRSELKTHMICSTCSTEPIYVSGLLTICSSCVSFWYRSEALPFGFDICTSDGPSMLILSSSTLVDCFRGFMAVFLRTGIFFCFLALGGVVSSIEWSWSEASSIGDAFSSSLSTSWRFFVAVFVEGFVDWAFLAAAGLIDLVAFVTAGFLVIDFFCYLLIYAAMEKVRVTSYNWRWWECIWATILADRIRHDWVVHVEGVCQPSLMCVVEANRRLWSWQGSRCCLFWCNQQRNRQNRKSVPKIAGSMRSALDQIWLDSTSSRLSALSPRFHKLWQPFNSRLNLKFVIRL